MCESTDMRIPAMQGRRTYVTKQKKRRGKLVKNVRWSSDAKRMRNRYKPRVYRQVKDRLFRFLFEKNQEALLQLYNALKLI